MTILGYSGGRGGGGGERGGRGWGGRGRGRGGRFFSGGRHPPPYSGGRHASSYQRSLSHHDSSNSTASSHKWERPKQKEDDEALDDSKPSQGQPKEDTTTTATTTKTENASTIIRNRDMKREGNYKLAASNKSQSHTSHNNNDNTWAPQQQGQKRKGPQPPQALLGRHKLVLRGKRQESKKEGSLTDNTSNQQQEQQHEQHEQQENDDSHTASHEKQAAVDSTNSPQHGFLSDENVDNSSRRKANAFMQVPDSQPGNKSNPLERQHLKKIGVNKLVLNSKQKAQETASVTAMRKPTSLAYAAARNPINKSLMKRPPPCYAKTKHPQLGGLAKRIKLMAAESSTDNPVSLDVVTTNEHEGSNDKDIVGDGVSTNEENSTREQHSPHADETNLKNKQYTDFAYRESSRVAVRARGQNRTWTSSSQSGPGGSASNNNPGSPNRGRRNMGLVRVQPNEQRTPVCPIFLRGVECTNKYCRKRHDIPKEYTMPVCSFFQRHGQCRSGDECKFRHVKVNPRAVVCPSFAVLGFCDDADCTMKHVRENNNKHANKM